MEKNNSRTWLWILGIFVVVIILFFVFQDKKIFNSEVNPATNNQVETEPTSVQDVSEDAATGVAPVTLTYDQALVKYVDRRIQLDKVCQAHPNNITYKDNTGIMIDNRSPQTRTVKVGTTFTIKPYSFKIVVLPDVYMTTKTLLVDCDGSQNVATILIQE